MITRQFADRAVFDAIEKTAISVRDGVLEYMGSELGIEPPDRIFTVFRSPATIANAAMAMAGIPLTDDHVSVDVPATDGAGRVSEAQMIDASDPDTMTTIAIRNRVEVGDTLMPMLDSGKRQLSLGYKADLVPHDRFDFEQRNIQPHHLAVVENGRCGGMCSFLDRKPEISMKINKAFADENGEVNLQKIVEIAAALPEAIKMVPIERVSEIMPALQELIELSRQVNAATEEPATEEPVEDEAVEDEPQEPVTDEQTEEPVTDEKDEKQFSDAAVKVMVQKATDEAIKAHAEVMDKARSFVDESYEFKGKSTAQIMRDAIATQSSETFTDAELPLAFKLLKKTADYRNFGDAGADKFDQLKDKEL